MVLEPEPVGALSARKLVLETAKFNVITAHSFEEGIECFDTFPKVSAAVIATQDRAACQEMGRYIKARNPGLPVIVLSPVIGFECPGADHHLSSHKPEKLLTLMRELLGDPIQME